MEYKTTIVPSYFAGTIPDVEKFEASDQDICIVTYSKCGTTFMAAVLQMILHDGDMNKVDHVPFLEFADIRLAKGQTTIDKLAATPPPRQYVTHLPFRALPKSVLDKVKIIYVARNPKDCMVSCYHFYKALKNYDQNSLGSLENFVGKFLTSNEWYGPFFDHVASGWVQHQEKPDEVFFTTYERMVKDLKSVACELSEFLGKRLTEEQMAAVVHHCRFDVMKDNDRINYSHFYKSGFMDATVSKFMRKGEIGNWKEQLSPALDLKVNDWIAREESRLAERFDGFCFEYE